MWLPEDTELVLGHFQLQNETCSGCGHPKNDSFAVGNDWAYRGVAIACHACAASRRAEKRLDDTDGVYSYAVKRGDPT